MAQAPGLERIAASDPDWTGTHSLSTGPVFSVAVARAAAESSRQELVVVKGMHAGANTAWKSVVCESIAAAAQVRGPHLVRTVGAHVTHDGAVRVAMEYVSGESLRYVLDFVAAREMRLPPALSCLVGADAAGAICALRAHPSAPGSAIDTFRLGANNVLLGYDGRVRVVHVTVPPASRLPIDAWAFESKAACIAPEQLDGGDAGARSRLFVLGALLYESLTSRKLFSGPTHRAIVTSLRTRRVMRPSVYNPAVPAELDELVMRLLSRQPAERPSAAVAREQLLACARQLGADGATAACEWMSRALCDRIESRRAAEQRVVRASPVLSAGRSALPPFFPVQSQRTAPAPGPALSVIGESRLPPQPQSRARPVARLGGVAIAAASAAVLVAVLRPGATQSPGGPNAPEVADAPAASLRSSVGAAELPRPPRWNAKAPKPSAQPSTGGTTTNDVRPISVELSAEPKHAVVYFDGRAMAGNPARFESARDRRIHVASARARGYVTRRVEVVASTDVKLVFSLAKAKVGRRAARGASRTVPPTVVDSPRSNAAPPVPATDPPRRPELDVDHPWQ